MMFVLIIKEEQRRLISEPMAYMFNILSRGEIAG